MTAAVGIFAGRGDVVLAMGMALIFGAFLGWNVRKLIEWGREKWHK